jgi:hypothetical protein
MYQKIIPGPAGFEPLVVDMLNTQGVDTRVHLIKNYSSIDDEVFDKTKATPADFGGYAPAGNLNWEIEIFGADNAAMLFMKPLKFLANGQGPQNLICGHYVEKLVGDEWQVMYGAIYINEGTNTLAPVRVGDSKTSLEVFDEISIVSDLITP